MQISRHYCFRLLLSGAERGNQPKIPAAEALQAPQFTEDGQTLPVGLTAVPDSTTDGFQLHFTAQPQITAASGAGRHCVSTADGTTRYFFSAEAPAVTARKSQA